jgi:hypothetical protein
VGFRRSTAVDRRSGAVLRLCPEAELKLDRSLDRLGLSRFRGFDAKGWYDFLLNEYFRWKYTVSNRYASTTRHLEKHGEGEGLAKLDEIRLRLLCFNADDTCLGLDVARTIPGLGVAGASGLLAIMYPAKFGTVDQFVLKALRDVGTLPESSVIAKMKPGMLVIGDAIIVIGALRRKADALNKLFGGTSWTPRKVDKVLWAFGRSREGASEVRHLLHVCRNSTRQAL